MSSSFAALLFAAACGANSDPQDAGGSHPEQEGAVADEGGPADAGARDADSDAPRDAATSPQDAAADKDAGSDAGQVTAGTVGVPPDTWKEHWFEHVQTLKLVAYNDWVALYFDDDVDRKQTEWILPFMTRVWQYTVEHYGQFTDGKRDGRLYAIYHQGKYSGGHPSTYFDGSHDYRNVSDVGPGPFPDGSYAISTHEVSHVVEGASRQMHGSPAFNIWGDSKWAEFYQYDLYMGLGMTEEAQRVYKGFTATTDDFPSPGTHWFRDWFYPLWRDHGGTERDGSLLPAAGQALPQERNQLRQRHEPR
ncbi:MAG: hypothetical protein QM778_28130 [Myxococcales bacterium]